MNFVIAPIAHGVEFKQIQQDYAKPLIDNIRSCLTQEENKYFIPLPYNYTTKTNSRQNQMFEATDKGLGNEELRRLKHTVGSDVTWSFIIAKDGKECFYTDFVNDLTNLIENSRVKYPSCKVVCIGHSQGTQLFYSFFFDYPKLIDCFVSMGSPISMNSGAFPDFGKKPNILGSWINFYNDVDFVSSRLQGYHPSKEISNFVIDYNVPLGWNPIYHLPDCIFKSRLVAGLMGHVMYWKSKFVAEKIAEKSRELINQP